MDRLEILETEINDKIIFIQKQLEKILLSGKEVGNNNPKHLDLIANLETENANLKREHTRIEEEHRKDLEEINDLVKVLSKLVESGDA